MVQCESAKVVLFEWSHPRISSTDLRVKESPFALLLPPFLWVTGYRIFFSSSSYPLSWLFQFSDHRRTIQTVRGMVMSLTTCDLIHLLFCNGCSRLCFVKHFSRSLESSRERRSRVARDITMPRTVWMVRLWSDIYSGNTDTHVPKKKKHYTAVYGNFTSPNFCIFTLFP